jgi:radical SAM-linked protein
VPQQPEQQPPPVQKLRVRYAKRGRLRFTSHRDFGRAFERAIQRARIPIAYSSGFTPHPRISYANASPTGAASEAEYLEIGVAEVCDPDDVRLRLDTALPEGLDVLDVVIATPGALADRLQASHWIIALPEVEAATVQAAVETFLAHEAVLVERMTKRGMRSFDCRAAVVSMSVRVDAVDGQECAIIDVVVLHGTPAVRPDDILAGLRETAGLAAPVPPLQTRLAQGPLDRETGAVGDPLDHDRDAEHQPGDR